VSNILLTDGSALSLDSYTLCGRYIGSVNNSIMITINCAPSSHQFRFVIIRSSDSTPEMLCLAEVAVYNESQYMHCSHVYIGATVMLLSTT